MPAAGSAGSPSASPPIPYFRPPPRDWRKIMQRSRSICLSAAVLASVLSLGGAAAQAAGETVQSMLAAQIRTQGFTCDKPLAAKRDARCSKPDHVVWVLKCSNATYRVSRAPDMAAKVEPLR
jgi:hypothetical protein